jgi:hypothetical protein
MINSEHKNQWLKQQTTLDLQTVCRKGDILLKICCHSKCEAHSNLLTDDCNKSNTRMRKTLLHQTVARVLTDTTGGLADPNVILSHAVMNERYNENRQEEIRRSGCGTRYRYSPLMDSAQGLQQTCATMTVVWGPLVEFDLHVDNMKFIAHLE